MKFRLKKLYQTLTHSITAGTVKTVDEWTRIMPELWGNDLTKTFPDWFEKVIPELQITTCAWRDGQIVYGRTGNDYDGKRLDKLYLVVNLESKEDVRRLIDYLSIHQHCFLPERQYPLTPSDCFYIFEDANGRKVRPDTQVWLKYKGAGQLIPVAASFAVTTGCKWFKNYPEAYDYYYNVR